MISVPKITCLLLSILLLLLNFGCSRDPGVELDLEVVGIHLMQGGPLVLDLDYHWRRDPGFKLDFEIPNIYVHFLNDEKEIVLQDDYPSRAELVDGNENDREIHYQRSCVLFTSDPALYDYFSQSRVRIRVGFYEVTEMTRKHRVFDRRVKIKHEPAPLPMVTTLESPGTVAGDGWQQVSLPRLLPSATIKRAGSPGPVAVRLIPDEQLALLREQDKPPSGSLGIDMPAGCSVEYAVQPPAGTLLDFTPLAGGENLFRVTLVRTDGGEETLLAKAVRGAGDQITLPLPVTGDEVVTLRLTCEGRGLGTWADARLLVPLLPNPGSRPEEGRLVELRDSARDWNILLVILDATRADALSCYGNPERFTPTLDRIAGRSVQFVEHHTPASYTIASTASLFSGLHPTTHRVLDWNDRLWDGFPVLAEMLAEAGKTTASITANPWISANFGMARGFDHFVVVPDIQDQRMDAEAVNSCLDQLIPLLGEPGSSPPFYLYLHYLEPHMPYDPPEPIRELVTQDSNHPDLVADKLTIRKPEFIRGEERDELVHHYRALYQGNLMNVDFQLAKALASLRRDGLLDRTLIIITSDHGEAFLEHGRMAHGYDVYAEVVTVPLLISFPPDAGPLTGIRWDRVNTMDTTAFLLELFSPTNSPLAENAEGMSYLPSILREESRQGEFSVLLSALEWPNAFGIFDDNHGLVVGARGVELFDRVTDPYQRSPDLGAESMLRTYLRQRLMSHLMDVTGLESEAVRPGSSLVGPELRDQLVALGYAGE